MYINQVNSNVFIADSTGQQPLQGDAATLSTHKAIVDNPSVFAVVDSIPDNYNLLVYEETLQ